MSDGDWTRPALESLIEDAIGGLWGSPPDAVGDDLVDVLVVRGADFRNWDFARASSAAHRRVPKSVLKRRQLASGDLVLEVSGGGPTQPVGRTVLIDEQALASAQLPLICSNFCRKIKLKPGVDPRFVSPGLSVEVDDGV